MSEATRKLKKWMGLAIVVERRWVYSALMTLAISLMLTLAGANLHVAQAQGTITRCEPEAAYVPANEQATVCIYVQDVVDLYGADFELSFPGMVGIATIVDKIEDEEGVQIQPSTAFLKKPWNLLFNSPDSSTGYLHYLVTQLTDANPPKTGSGPIACMTFQPVAAGSFSITFTRHQLSTINGTLIGNTAHTCSVTFVNPTAVTLTRFAAQAKGQGVYIQWETAQEIDTLGFNLYRSTTASGSKTKLNQNLIPTKEPPGSSVGAVYNWIDATKMRPRRTLYYWLEEVDIYGHATMHGPAKVSQGRTTE